MKDKPMNEEEFQNYLDNLGDVVTDNMMPKLIKYSARKYHIGWYYEDVLLFTSVYTKRELKEFDKSDLYSIFEV